MNQGTRVRVYVADEHPVFCDGVVLALRQRPEFEVVRAGEDGREALADLAEPERQRPLLSPRELEVLRLTAGGRSALAIGRDLHLSPETVKTHLTKLDEKLGVGDGAAAVAGGMRRGPVEEAGAPPLALSDRSGCFPHLGDGAIGPHRRFLCSHRANTLAVVPERESPLACRP